MITSPLRSWQAVQAEVLRRIQSRTWQPGALIPHEVALAEEFGCARATVNRALQALADRGLLDRRRKAGTRVATLPVRRATLDIPILRQEIENRGHRYDYSLLKRDPGAPPADVRIRMRLPEEAAALHVEALHLADGRPYVVEDRWINTAVVPAIQAVDLAQLSANEWLVAHAPFTRGDVNFMAASADETLAPLLQAKPGDALFVIERGTWAEERAITLVRLSFAPGYRLYTAV